MANNIITPEFRAAFISVFKATSAKNSDGSMGAPKFSIRAVFAPGTDISALKAEASTAAKDKWGDKIPKTMRSPFRFNEELENPIPGIPDDAIIMTFSSNQDRRPGIVDASLQDIIDESEVYSGAYYRAQVRAYAYDTAGNKGVSFGLQNVQKLKDGEPLGGGKTPANKAFEAVATGGSSSANDLFV